MKFTSINNIDLSEDGGDAHTIRTNFIHKGLTEEGIDLKIFSCSTNYDSTPCNDNGRYILYSLRGKSYFLKKIWFLINPIIFFKFLLSIPKEHVILIDKLALNLILPFIFFKILKKNIVVAQYHEFFTFHNEPKNKVVKAAMKVYFHLLKILLKHVDLLIVISDAHGKYFANFMKKVNFIVIPILMDCKSSTEKYTKEKKFRICYAGAISKSNGVEILLQAIKNIPSLQLDIFGNCISSYKEHLEQKYKITVGESKNNEEAKKVLAMQNLLVIPKINDERAIGYIPSKLGDYFNSGVPVLATKVGIINQYIVDNVNGFVVEPDNIEEMHRKVLSIMNLSEEELQKIGKKGRLSAQQFQYQTQVKILLKALRKLYVYQL